MFSKLTPECTFWWRIWLIALSIITFNSMAGEIPILIKPADKPYEAKITEVVQNNLLSQGRYLLARVEVETGLPNSLHVRLISSETYDTETVTITLNENYQALNGDVPVQVFNGEDYETLPPEDLLADIIKKQVLLPAKVPYIQARIKPPQTPPVVIEEENLAMAWTVYLLRQDIYLAEVEKVVVNQNGEIISIENGNDGAEVLAEKSSTCPDPTVEMVFATECDYFRTAKNAVNEVYNLATSRGYKAVKLIGKEATVQAYKNWLSCKLKAFGNIGHSVSDDNGDIVSLYLRDGELPYEWFQSLPATALRCNVMFLNSCSVVNRPFLEPAILHAGARAFMGGENNLRVGPSEEVFKNFWNNVLPPNNQLMKQTLFDWEAAIRAKGKEPGRFGFSGDDGAFLDDCSAALSGKVWEDTDGDCSKDSDEAVLSGWTVSLTPQPSSEPLFSEQTDANGNYRWVNLSPGKYEVSLNLGEAWLPTCPQSPHAVELAIAQTTTDLNFGVAEKTTLTVTKTGRGNITGTGISCGPDCTGDYPKNTSITLTASPADSYQVTWSGACSGTTTTCAITMDQSKTVTATFSRIPSFELTVSKAGPGEGTVTGEGINCGEDCTDQYPPNTQVTLTAVPATVPNSTFLNWGGDCVGTSPEIVVTMDANKSCIAHFGAGEPSEVSLTLSKTGNGTVRAREVGNTTSNITCSTPSCTSSSGKFARESNTTPPVVVVVRASPMKGSLFTGWGEDCSGTSEQLVKLVLDSDKSCSAHFTLIPLDQLPPDMRRLTVHTKGPGEVIVGNGVIRCGNICENNYLKDKQISLKAVPGTSATFKGWKDDCKGSKLSARIIMSANMTCTAEFQ